MIDISDLIGKPYHDHGRGPGSYDCYGLARECYLRWHGILPPDYPCSRSPRENAVTVDGALRGAWERLSAPVPGSVVVMRVREFGAHVGFVYSPTRMIHTLRDIGAASVRLKTFKNQIMGAYRYVG